MNQIGRGLAVSLSSIVLSSAVLLLPAAAQSPPAQQAAKDLVVVAKKVVKRSYRRSRGRSAARRPARSEEAIMPLPRSKPDETSLAALPATEPPARPPEAPGTATAALPIPSNPAAAKAELRALYSVTVLGDRCNFPISTREGAVLDHSVTSIEAALKLDTQEADAIYSDVDLTLAAKAGGKICQPGSPEAKAFRATLDRLLGR